MKNITLRSKVFIILGGALIISYLSVFIISKYVFVESFAQLEQHQSLISLDQVQAELESQMELIDTLNRDWSWWDDSYEFSQNQNDEYIKSNLTNETFTDLGLDIIGIFDSTGKPIYLSSFDFEKNEINLFPPDLISFFKENIQLLYHEDTESGHVGILLLPDQPMLFTSRPILTSELEGPIQGSIVFGRYINNAVLQDISKKIEILLVVKRLDMPLSSGEEKLVADCLASENNTIVRVANEKDIFAYQVIDDVFKKPGLLLIAKLRRSIYQQGLKTIKTYHYIMLGLSVLFSFIIIILMETQVLVHIRSLTNAVLKIEENPGKILSVPEKGPNEVLGLSKTINSMLGSIKIFQQNIQDKKDALEDSNKKLKEQISERQKAENKFRTLFDSTSDAIMIYEMEGSLLEVNQAACNSLGYSRDELIRMKPGQFMSSQYLKNLAENSASLQNQGKDIFEMDHIRKDGSIIPVELSCKLFEYDKKKAILAITRDISERKKIEKERLRAQNLESLGVLAGGIAHDFNNLLTGILGNILLGKNQVDPASKVYKNLLETEKAALRAADLTRQLLTFSKGGAPVKDIVRVNDIIKDSSSFALRGSNSLCEFHFPDKLWIVNADKGQLSQVFQNLVINASQAMPEGGVITIKAQNQELAENEILNLEAGRYVVISIMDKGVGISQKHLEKIFDPYFSTKQTGSGLGLAVVHSIIESHGGKINVKSEMGQETTFIIYLPAVLRERHKATNAGGDILKGSGKILVMDDDDIIRSVSSNILKELGYDPQVAKDGEEAIELYQKALKNDKPYNLVIIDLTIPGGMSGKETMENLLVIDPDIKAIVSSGYANNSIMADYKAYGFKGAVIKPYSISELSVALKKIID